MRVFRINEIKKLIESLFDALKLQNPSEGNGCIVNRLNRVKIVIPNMSRPVEPPSGNLGCDRPPNMIHCSWDVLEVKLWKLFAVFGLEILGRWLRWFLRLLLLCLFGKKFLTCSFRLLSLELFGGRLRRRRGLARGKPVEGDFLWRVDGNCASRPRMFLPYCSTKERRFHCVIWNLSHLCDHIRLLSECWTRMNIIDVKNRQRAVGDLTKIKN